MTWTSPDLADNNPNNVVALELQMQSYGLHAKFYGQVVTLKCFEDNSLVKELASTDGEGKVLVVDGAASIRKALLGDMIAANFVKNGWAGVIINGVIRDVEIINTLALGVKALGCVPLKTEKRGEGQKHIPIAFGGVTFTENDFIYSDANGILVSDSALI